jgi:hypothetical protein
MISRRLSRASLVAASLPVEAVLGDAARDLLGHHIDVTRILVRPD